MKDTEETIFCFWFQDIPTDCVNTCKIDWNDRRWCHFSRYLKKILAAILFEIFLGFINVEIHMVNLHEAENQSLFDHDVWPAWTLNGVSAIFKKQEYDFHNAINHILVFFFITLYNAEVGNSKMLSILSNLHIHYSNMGKNPICVFKYLNAKMND